MQGAAFDEYAIRELIRTVQGRATGVSGPHSRGATHDVCYFRYHRTCRGAQGAQHRRQDQDLRRCDDRRFHRGDDRHRPIPDRARQGAAAAHGLGAADRGGLGDRVAVSAVADPLRAWPAGLCRAVAQCGPASVHHQDGLHGRRRLAALGADVSDPVDVQGDPLVHGIPGVVDRGLL